MNYTTLRSVLQNYSQNYESSFAENIDNFIRLAESRILLRVRLPSFRKDVTANCATPNALLAVPSDFLAPDSLAIVTLNGLVFPLNKDPEFLDQCYPNPNYLGTPRFYAYLNETALKLGPPPDQNYPVRMGYFYSPPSIVDAGTTWLGNNFFHALISGSLVEASTYMKSEDDLFTRYANAFEKDLAMDLEYAKGRTRKDTAQEPDVRMPA